MIHKKWEDYYRTLEDLEVALTQYRYDVDVTPVLESETQRVRVCSEPAVFSHGLQMGSSNYVALCFYLKSFRDRALMLENMATKLSNIGLVTSLKSLTSQLQQAVTSSQCQQWLSDKLSQLCTQQAELLDIVRLSATTWSQASQHMELYESGCKNAQHCILGKLLVSSHQDYIPMISIYIHINFSRSECEELIASLDPNCDLRNLESQVNSAKEADAALQRISWDELFDSKRAVQQLVQHPLLLVSTPRYYIHLGR